jgi:hypothetical protein
MQRHDYPVLSFCTHLSCPVISCPVLLRFVLTSPDLFRRTICSVSVPQSSPCAPNNPTHPPRASSAAAAAQSSPTTCFPHQAPLQHPYTPMMTRIIIKEGQETLKKPPKHPTPHRPIPSHPTPLHHPNSLNSLWPLPQRLILTRPATSLPVSCQTLTHSEEISML